MWEKVVTNNDGKDDDDDDDVGNCDGVGGK